MPFDEGHSEGGGGPGGRHDPKKMNDLATLSLLQLSVNCENNDVCEFHAGLWMLGLMATGMVETVRKHAGDATSIEMIEEHMAALRLQLKRLEEERSLWPTPTTSH